MSLSLGHSQSGQVGTENSVIQTGVAFGLARHVGSTAGTWFSLRAWEASELLRFHPNLLGGLREFT